MFTVVTDSSVYLTKKEAEQLHVKVVPLSYTVDNQNFLERYTDENGRFRELLRNSGNLHTSQVSIGSFLSIFNDLLLKGQDILCITISSRLSGTYANALMAAKEINSDKIAIIDSLSTAGGLKFLVEKASALSLSKDNFTLKQAVDVVEKLREKIGVAFSVDDMVFLRKSGRLGFVRQSVSTILNVRPILLLNNGSVTSNGTVRGMNAQIAELIKCIPENAKRIIVHYIDMTSRAETFEQAVRKNFGNKVEVCPLGPVLGIHLGSNVLGVSWLL